MKLLLYANLLPTPANVATLGPIEAEFSRIAFIAHLWSQLVA
jgi:hypothetical protein